MEIGKLLAELAQGWRVDLASTGPDSTWTLTLSGRGRDFTYRGTLSSVVARAYAGERGDV